MSRDSIIQAVEETNLQESKGFNNEKYVQEQTDAILKRVEEFGGKLYLECGGKLIFDYHASRVLPGFDPNVKMRVFSAVKEKIEVIICIYAGDIERKKMRNDFGLSYDADALKLIDDFTSKEIKVNSVVITRYDEQPAVVQFKDKLERRGMKVYTHKATPGYPTDVDRIVSAEGYGKNSYIETTKPIVLVTAPGPGSGKLATCLSQFYHDYQRGISSGYAKFETFPIWNLPLKHPVNVAYEAATADLGDVNQIDPFHLEAYGKTCINYNRDIEAFPVLKRIIEKITGKESFYKSPTDMGVNRCGFGIVNDSKIQLASKQEIIRRYYHASCEYVQGTGSFESIERIKLLMDDLDLKKEDRTTVAAAAEARISAYENGKGHDGIICGAAIELQDSTIIKGSNSITLHAASALILNAVKHLAGIPKDILLIPVNILEAVKHLKGDILNGRQISLDLEEVLIALAISATVNPIAQLALETLPQLKECEMHMTHLPSNGDIAGLRKLGIRLTSDSRFASHTFLDE